jgi:hypothetical protein
MNGGFQPGKRIFLEIAGKGLPVRIRKAYPGIVPFRNLPV